MFVLRADALRVPPEPQMQTWAPGSQMNLLVTDDPDEIDQADHVLLYLNLATWSDDDADRRDALTDEVHARLHPAQQDRQPSRTSRISLGGGMIDSISPRQPLLLVHEVDEQRGGVAEFGYFFGAGVTPPELLKLGIYAEIAIPMKAGEYRSVSRGLLDRALRAEQTGQSRLPCLRRLADLCHLPPLVQRLMLPYRGASSYVAAPSHLRNNQLETEEGQRTGGYWRVYRHVLFNTRHARARASRDTLSPAAPPGSTHFTPLGCGGNAASEPVPRKRPVSVAEHKFEHTLAPRETSLPGTSSASRTRTCASMLPPPARETGSWDSDDPLSDRGSGEWGSRRPSILPPPARGSDESLSGTRMSAAGRRTHSRPIIPPLLARRSGAGGSDGSLSDAGSGIWSSRRASSMLPPPGVRGTESTFPAAAGCGSGEFKQERVHKPGRSGSSLDVAQSETGQRAAASSTTATQHEGAASVRPAILTVEQRINKLEKETNIDIDEDGDVGEDGHFNRALEA